MRSELRSILITNEQCKGTVRKCVLDRLLLGACNESLHIRLYAVRAGGTYTRMRSHDIRVYVATYETVIQAGVCVLACIHTVYMQSHAYMHTYIHCAYVRHIVRHYTSVLTLLYAYTYRHAIDMSGNCRTICNAVHSR